MILIDSRETREVKDRGLQFFGDRARVESLIIGDVLLNNTVVERKTPEDLIKSKISEDKHLDTQCKRMTSYETRILVVEGSFFKLCEREPRYQKYDSDWYYGLVSSLQVNYGMSVFPVPNNVEFWKYIGKLAYKSEHKKQVELSQIYTPKLTRKNKSVPLSMLCVVPGINEKVGLQILEKFSPYQLYDASLEDLQDINGVGPVMSKRIKAVFNKEREVKA